MRKQIITCPSFEWSVSYSLSDCRFHTGFDDGQSHIAYLISTMGTRRVWPVSRGCTYCSNGPDPTITFVRNLCYRALYFVFALWALIMFITLLNLLFCILSSDLSHWKKFFHYKKGRYFLFFFISVPLKKQYNPNYCETRTFWVPTIQNSSLN